MNNENRISEVFCFVLANGERVYPHRIRRRDNGQMTFRVSKQGNSLGDSIDVLDDEELKRKVIDLGYAVRMVSRDGKRAGLYRVGGRSFRRLELKAP